MKETMHSQLPAAVVMVRPAAFGLNPQTAAPHWFYKEVAAFTKDEISRRARIEFDRMVERLRKAAVEVYVVDDTPDPVTPNAVFLNNWLSFHDDGSAVLYPLFAPNRRPERRSDILDLVRSKDFTVSRVIDLTHHEKDGRFLEGTGSIAFDHAHRRAYANLSPRTNPGILEELCGQLGFQPVTFRARDEHGKEIMHTDVMMSIGDRFAIVCLEAIADESERRMVSSLLRENGRELIAIDQRQRAQFAGNVLQVRTAGGDSVLVMSTAALHTLRPEQRVMIQNFTRILEAPLSVIEGIEGSSARCMMAGIHLPRA
jgi:hypothetical protein